MALPPLELRLRTEDAGGEVAPVSPTDPLFGACSKPRIVLLIHGYNNAVPDARDAYAGFVAQQQALAAHAPGGDFAPDRELVEVFWKGDDWGFMSWAYYTSALPNAKRSAALLADALRTLARLRAEGLTVDIVAHSMGTRLALELLRHLRGGDGVAVRRAVFFAAATPTFKLEDAADAGGLRAAYDSELGDGLLSLYSGSDSVLSLAFPLGQTFAGAGEGFFPTALGHAYWPSPHAPATLAQEENRGAGHGDYWGWRKERPRCESFANGRARDYLGFTGLGDRRVAGVDIATRTVGGAAAPPARTSAARATATRTA